MHVFVGNPTLQHRELHYRHPSQPKTSRVVRIAAGGQEQLPDDLSGADLKNVLAQLERLGAVPKSDLRAIVLPKALIYDVSSTPIEIGFIEEGLERDGQARQEVAGTKMEEAGLAAFNSAQKASSKVVETVLQIVERDDQGEIKGSVDAEIIVSSKPQRRAGRKRTEDKN
jgi:hypothetical protein